MSTHTHGCSSDAHLVHLKHSPEKAVISVGHTKVKSRGLQSSRTARCSKGREHACRRHTLNCMGCSCSGAIPGLELTRRTGPRIAPCTGRASRPRTPVRGSRWFVCRIWCVCKQTHTERNFRVRKKRSSDRLPQHTHTHARIHNAPGRTQRWQRSLRTIASNQNASQSVVERGNARGACASTLWWGN
jgi:hypothetical protein